MQQNSFVNKFTKNNRFYYGWITLGITSLCVFFSGPGQTYFASVFIDEYIKDFGWDRSTVSGIYSAATLLSGLLLFLVGRLSDRFGQKKMILLAAGLLGASCLWNSFLSSTAMLFAGFFIGRLTGQGSLTLLPSIIVPRWFVKRRAFAFSMMSMGGVIGSAILPPINTGLIGNWGWSGVWRLWAGLLWFFFIPAVYFFLYDKPEDLSLLPDHASRNEIGTAKLADLDDQEKSVTLKEAMRTRSFWGMLYCHILLPMITTGVVFHFVSILGKKGLSAASASFVLSLLAVVSFPMTLMAGYLLDRMKKHHAAVLISLLQLAGLIILLYSSAIYMVVAFAVLQGTAMGLQSVWGGVVWPEYFGMKHLGSIRGVVMTATVISSAVGPMPFGISFDAFGTYKQAFFLMMLFAALGIFAAFFSSKPEAKTGV